MTTFAGGVGRRDLGRRVAAALVACAVLAPASASAQLGLGQPGLGGPGGGSKKAPKKPTGDETHAASGADDTQKLQTAEPSLPPDPLAIPPAIRDQIGTTFDPDIVTGVGPKTDHTFYGLYYRERAGDVQFQTVFPLWAEWRQKDDRASWFGYYYNRRSKEHDADVFFPFFWKLREHDTQTTVIAPYVHREAPATKEHVGRHDNWVPPLVFEGATSDGGGYFHVPPLLTYTEHTSHSGLSVVGPTYCKWKGGSSCDPRSADKIDLGVAPLYLYGRDETTEYEVIPPLLRYYHFNEVGDKSFDLWGPLLWEHSRESDVFNVMPIYWHNWGKNEDHLTVAPLFHYGYKGNSNLFITPFFVNYNGEKGEKGFATWGYARYRGRTEYDMWSPLFHWYRDPDIELDRKLVFPFYYRNTSPRSDDIAAIPFYAHFNKPGLSETFWVTPLFRTNSDVTGWDTELFPLFYVGRKYKSTHTVAIPFLWDFASQHSRVTLALPGAVRIADDTTVSQVTLNTYYHERKLAQGTEWEFHFFPLFSYGESPNGHWWNLFYGMAGYTREGTSAKMRTFYIPITLSE